MWAGDVREMQCNAQLHNSNTRGALRARLGVRCRVPRARLAGADSAYTCSRHFSTLSNAYRPSPARSSAAPRQRAEMLDPFAPLLRF